MSYKSYYIDDSVPDSNKIEYKCVCVNPCVWLTTASSALVSWAVFQMPPSSLFPTAENYVHNLAHD